MTTDVFTEAVAALQVPTRSRNRLRVIAQDPTVLGEDGRILTASADVPRARLEPGPRSPRFHVVDFDVTTGTYTDPAVLPSDGDSFADDDDETLRTDRAFHAQQVYAVAARTLATFEAALGRRVSWAFSGHQLYLVPHAFAEGNAYYSWEDRALLFGYVPQGTADGATVYTCLSHDVVAHETAHAVLDGLRRRFLEPGLPDQPAFHEGFADIVALLSVFSMRPVVESALGPARDGRIDRRRLEPEQLRRSVLTGVAEQLGDVLTQGRGALRQSALQPPPPGWETSPAYLEPHRRGEVLVAVVIDVLIDIWVRRLEPLLAPDGERRPRTLDRKRAAEEGAKAASHLLTMLIRGLDYLPPVEFEFGDLLDAVILADEEVAPDDELGYRDALLQRFGESGIVRPPGQAFDLLEGAFAPRYHGLNFAAMRTDADEVYRFMWENAQEFGIDTSHYTHVDTVRPSQRVGPDGLIVSESVAGYIQMLELTVGELEKRYGRSLPIDLAPDTRLQIFGGGTLVFDQFGRAKLHVYKPIDDWTRQVRRLEYLHRAGLYREGGTVGATYGLARGQSFAQLHSSDAGTGETW
ncbi:MAG: hypothetical protein ACXWXO_02105 [Nocardioides sp.]